MLPLVSESFANVATRGTASFGVSGTSGIAGPGTGTIRYDAAASTYMLTTGGGSITFQPADIDAAQSNAGAVVYVQHNGSATDSLVLTRPGMSGRLTYRYVGSAFWQHTAIGASSGSGWIDAMAYGVEAPLAAVPATGRANFDIDLIGAESQSMNVAPLSGAGKAAIDFGTGSVIITGTLAPVQMAGPVNFSGIARIGTGSNGFSGSFTFYDNGQFAGTVDGKLFGPGAEELGAAFAASLADGRVAVGTLTGRRGAADIINARFYDNPATLLSYSQSFVTDAVRVNFGLPLPDGDNGPGDLFSGKSLAAERLTFRYDQITNTYTVIAPDLGQTLPTTQSIPLDANGGEAIVELFTPSMGTSYVQLGRWSIVRPHTGGIDYRRDYFALGMPTGDSSLVRTGSAGFKIDVMGGVLDKAYGNVLNLSGVGDFFADLASGAIRARIPVSLNESRYVFPTFPPPLDSRSELSFTGTLSASANGFSGTSHLLGNDGYGNYSGTMTGRFYGPAGEEVGGTFTLTEINDPANGIGYGAFAGKRDGSVLDPSRNIQNLDDLVIATELTAQTIKAPGTPSGISMVLYHPSLHVFEITLPTPTQNVTGASWRLSSDRLDPSQPLTGYASYSVTAAGQRTSHVTLLKRDNPGFELSYMSLGEFVQEDGTTPLNWYRSFAIFGRQTDVANMPVSGTASYVGQALAHATVTAFGAQASSSGIYTVTGATAMTVDFGAQTFTALVNSLVGQRIATPDGNFNSGTYNFAPLNYSGSLSGGNFSTTGSSDHSFSGRFFGNNATEVGALFFDRQGQAHIDPLAIDMTGAVAGKRN